MNPEHMLRLPFVEGSMFAATGAVAAWFVVGFAWPVVGPYLLEPCPMPTSIGVKAAAAVGALWGIAKAVELDLARRRRLQLPLAPRRHRGPL